jgi:Icc protein
MSDKKNDELFHDHNNDRVNRQGFLKCMAWAGTEAFCVMHGGVLKSNSLSRLSELNTAEATGDLSCAQISDSHMGFKQQHWCWEWELSAQVGRVL